MESLRIFKSLTRDQRNTFVACFLGWTLDALDFFLLTFVLVPVSQDFHRRISQVAFVCSEQTPMHQAAMNGELHGGY